MPYARTSRRRAIGATGFAALAAAGALSLPVALAETKPDAPAVAKGKLVYVRYCVSCHGKAARGDGPLANDLKVAVPDLTTMAARNAGRFPSGSVQRIIEGGDSLRGHGTADMPAWGDAFKRTEGTEARTPKEAIHNLSLYLASLQREGGK